MTRRLALGPGPAPAPALATDPVMVEAIEDEVCEDLVVMPPGAEHQGGAGRR